MDAPGRRDARRAVHAPRDELRHPTRVRPPAGKLRQHLPSGIRLGETNGWRAEERAAATRAVHAVDEMVDEQVIVTVRGWS